MSIRRRLFNVARAEFTSVFRKLFQYGETSDHPELNASESQKNNESVTPKSNIDFPVHISRAYANLELPLGSSADEIRAAYRRLMRRYHPDQHHGDQERGETATELSQELKRAHDELISFLEANSR